MKDKKVYKALTHFTIYELNSFSKFIRSPFHNMDDRLVRLYDVLEPSLKKDKDCTISPEVLWPMFMFDEVFNNALFLKLCSDLTTVIEDFIAITELKNHKSLITSLKLEGVQKRQVEVLYNGLINDTRRLQKLEKNQSVDYFYNTYKIERSLFNLKTENEKKNTRIDVERELNIRAISDSLDYFYIAEKLRLFCTLLSWKKMYNLNISIENIEFALNISEDDKYKVIPAINLYRNMQFTYLDESNVTHYFELRNIMKSYLHFFSFEEIREIYSTALNYCINRTNKGDTDFQKETFELFKEGLENNIFLVDSEMQPTMYRNISIAALRLNEFSWAEEFIQEYAKYLNEKVRENAVQFSMARLEYYKKNFRKVLQYLNNVNYEDVWYNLNAKSILIFTYYELKEFDPLESLLASFKMFIRREKSLSKDRKEHYLSLIKYIAILIKTLPKDFDKLEKIKNEITQIKGIVSKPLLLEKIDELLAKKK